MKQFGQISKEDRVEFFLKCQDILIKYHPNSPYVVRESNVDKTVDGLCANINKYNGYYYSDENICVLWNHIYVSDPKDVRQTLVENAYKPPHPNYNGVSIDFAVFRKMEDCLSFVKSNYTPQIEHILFVREGNPKMYKASQLLKNIKLTF
jgi:hypothetical protein